MDDYGNNKYNNNNYNNNNIIIIVMTPFMVVDRRILCDLSMTRRHLALSKQF